MQKLLLVILLLQAKEKQKVERERQSHLVSKPVKSISLCRYIFGMMLLNDITARLKILYILIVIPYTV